ncbi:hypothetical protein N8078_00665 [bacterium]|nr:hypothetical protein [bacterium]
MKKITYLLFLLVTTISFSQVGIGTTSPDASSVLDITATDAGLLVPRMTLTNRDNITAPATGLMIYQTDNTPGFYFYDGSAWSAFGGDSSSVSYSYMVPIWAEEAGNLANNQYEWAFGNGANTPSNAGITIYVPSDYTCAIVAMTATTNNSSGSSKIEANVNGSVLGASNGVEVTLSGRSGENDGFTPFSISNGDRLTFRTRTAGTYGNPSTVTAWLKYTKN